MKNQQTTQFSHLTKQVIVMLAVIGVSASLLNAEYMSLPLISSGFSWEASADGVNWLPAYPEYPNSVTVPYPATTDAVLMWYWNPANGNPTGSNGPVKAYFRATFMITDLHDKDVGAWIAADDWMKMSVNGISVATYLLTDEWVGGQPVAKFVDFTDQINTRYQGNMTGLNTITIEAHDGGITPANRSYEWLFFDAMSVDQRPVLGSLANMYTDPYADENNGNNGNNGEGNDDNNNGNGHHVPEPSIMWMLLLGGFPLLIMSMRRSVI